MPSRRHGNRCGPDRSRCHRRRLAAGTVQRAKSGPGKLSGSGTLIEPGRIVAFEPGRQDLGLPCTGGRLEALELSHHRLECFHAFHSRPRAHMLPIQQEPDEILGRHRLDLGTQAFGGVIVDPRQ